MAVNLNNEARDGSKFKWRKRTGRSEWCEMLLESEKFESNPRLPAWKWRLHIIRLSPAYGIILISLILRLMQIFFGRIEYVLGDSCQI